MYIIGVRKLFKPNFSKIRAISFTRKTNFLNYWYRLGNSLILPTDFVKGLGVHIYCKLNFHRLPVFLLSHAVKSLGAVTPRADAVMGTKLIH